MISVIVPVYRVENFIDRCVSSILSQTFTDFELLLVDDGSPDRSGELCEIWAKKDKRVRVLHKTNGGAADARNLALDRCAGEYIAFVDADDYVDPGYLQCLHCLIAAHPGAKMAISGWFCVRNGAPQCCLPHCEGVFSGRDVLEDILYEFGIYPSPCTKLYRKSIFDGLRFRKGMMFEDEDIFGEIMRRSDLVAVCREAHYYYVQNAESVSYRAFSLKKFEDQMTSDRHLCESALALDSGLARAVRRRRARNAMSLLRLMGGCRREFDAQFRFLRKRVLENAISVLFDRRASVRDKAGVLMLLPGGWSFFSAWTVYDFIRNHKGQRR